MNHEDRLGTYRIVDLLDSSLCTSCLVPSQSLLVFTTEDSSHEIRICVCGGYQLLCSLLPEWRLGRRIVTVGSVGCKLSVRFERTR